MLSRGWAVGLLSFCTGGGLAGLVPPESVMLHQLLQSKVCKSALQLTEFWLELVSKWLPFATCMLHNCHFTRFTRHSCSAENPFLHFPWWGSSNSRFASSLPLHTGPCSKGLGRPRDSAGPSSQWEPERACAQPSQLTCTIFSLLRRRLHPRQLLHRSMCSWGPMEIPLGNTANSVFPFSRRETTFGARTVQKP